LNPPSCSAGAGIYADTTAMVYTPENFWGMCCQIAGEPQWKRSYQVIAVYAVTPE